jgi:beta-lactamase regulating signal transducer with metallopeptidase domain
MRWLIQWAVSSAALILIVLAVRYLFRDRLSARLRYALWGVVLLRLLVPFQVELPAPVSDALPVLASNLAPEVGQWEEPSIPVFPERSKPVAEFELDIETTLEPGDILSYSDVVGCLRRDGETITWYRYILSPEQIVLALWLAGAGLTGAVMLVSNLRFSLRLRRRRRPLETDCLPPPVYVAEGLPSPCLFGVFQPAVYLTPEAAENPDTLRHILAHELTHCAHFDHLWSLLRCLALALHWYDPLVWLAVWLSKQDGELACDEGAVERLGEGERIPYGRTLVDMVAARSPRPRDLLSCSTAMTGGEKSIKARVLALVKKPETVKTALFAVIAVIALSAVFVFAEREEPVRNLYGPYRYQISHTQAVRYSPSPLSSQTYPDAITDPDLLEKALDILDHAADLLNTPEELDLDLSDAPFLSPRITLLEGPDDSGHTYLLYTAHAANGDQCYLVTPAEIGAGPCSVAAVLDTSAPGALELLARQQRHRKLEDLTPATDNVGLSFTDLTPGKEQVKEQTFIVQEVLSDISYSLTYESPVLTLDFGLRTADGTEVVCRTAYGGVANGTFEGVPAGAYQIFVRNMGDLNDYTQLPTYQPESGRDNATGAVNFQIIE